MLDELLDIFDRDRKDQRGRPKQGGIRGLLGRLTGDDDRRDDRNRDRDGGQVQRRPDDDGRYRTDDRNQDRDRQYDDRDRRYDDDRDRERRYDDDRRHPRREREGFELFDD